MSTQQPVADINFAEATTVEYFTNTNNSTTTSPTAAHLINTDHSTPIITATEYQNKTRLNELERAEDLVAFLQDLLGQILPSLYTIDNDPALYPSAAQSLTGPVQQYLETIEQLRALLHIHQVNAVTSVTVPVNVSSDGEVMKAQISSLLVGNVHAQIGDMLRGLEEYHAEVEDDLKWAEACLLFRNSILRPPLWSISCFILWYQCGSHISTLQTRSTPLTWWDRGITISHVRLVPAGCRHHSSWSQSSLLSSSVRSW